MRIDVRSVVRRHAVTSLRPLRGLLVPCRTFISRRPTPEEVQDIVDVQTTHFPLLSPLDYIKKQRQPNPEVRNIAILGGGITGLSTAFYVSKDFPQAKITIYEQSHRLGGWLDSERVQVEGGDVLFEWGPRSLRPDMQGSGIFTSTLLGRILNFTGHAPIVAIPRTAPASRNRFLYYGGKIIKMPGPGAGFFKTIIDTLYQFLSEPVFKGLIPQLAAEPSVPRRSSSLRDESVGQFVRRRFGSTIADNLTSALFHGIYAGDINKLSARALLPKAWYLEARDKDSSSGVLMEMMSLFFDNSSLRAYRLQRGWTLLAHGRSNSSNQPDRASVQRLNRITETLAPCSMYTFVDGLQQLSDSFVSEFSQNPNITIATSTTVKSLTYKSEDRCFTIGTSPTSPNEASAGSSNDASSSPTKFDYAIATIRPSTLSNILSSSSKHLPIPERAKLAFERVSHAVNVMVVNLYYTSPALLPTSLEGFGYLIPASVSVDENPERGLGVIFSSNASGPRGANATRRELRRTADECRSLRENMEHQFETDYNRNKLNEALEKYKQRVANDPNHIERDANNSPGWTVQKQIAYRLESLNMDWQFQIDNLKQQEEAAREREAQPGYDPENDFEETRLGQDTAEGTKLTVMLGGHWWDDWADSDLPTEAEGIEKAKSLLARHLKISDEPEVAKARLQRNCVPQYPVGYRDYMASIHKDVLAPIGGLFDGRLKVAGAYWQGGVGVNDCVRKARETAASLCEGWDECTGLEEYVGDEKWCLIDKKTGLIQPDMMSVNR